MDWVSVFVDQYDWSAGSATSIDEFGIHKGPNPDGGFQFPLSFNGPKDSNDDWEWNATRLRITLYSEPSGIASGITSNSNLYYVYHEVEDEPAWYDWPSVNDKELTVRTIVDGIVTVEFYGIEPPFDGVAFTRHIEYGDEVLHIIGIEADVAPVILEEEPQPSSLRKITGRTIEQITPIPPNPKTPNPPSSNPGRGPWGDDPYVPIARTTSLPGDGSDTPNIPKKGKDFVVYQPSPDDPPIIIYAPPGTEFVNV